ncbi:MAG: hypothetical protein U0792_15590 [Gemmataceae bacterium]
MPILTLAAKDLRLLLRDARSAVVLLVTPLILILVLEAGPRRRLRREARRLRISVVNLDRGLPEPQLFPDKPWSQVVMDDLTATAGIRLNHPRQSRGGTPPGSQPRYLSSSSSQTSPRT